MSLPDLSLTSDAHQLEAAQTLIQAGQFIVILFVARVLAEGMVRLRLPAILGELVAGVSLGVSGLYLIQEPGQGAELNSVATGAIAALAHVRPDQVLEVVDHAFPILQDVAKIGLLALLSLTGLECELDELVAVGGQAVTVALSGVVLPFALGAAGLHWLFAVPLLPAIFAGAAMTATSIGITASVLGELKMLRIREGQMVIGTTILAPVLLRFVLAPPAEVGAPIA